MSLDDKVMEVLQELKYAIKTESAIIDRNGGLMYSDFSYGFHANEIFGVMSATMLGAAKSITAECRKGVPKKIIIQTGNAHIIIAHAGSTAMLMCLIDAIRDMERTLDEIDKAAQRIKELMQYT
jgi:predicted regulator of Ras-like GTPase activity (Roadblock/LC7/MglB family)